jgi:AraC-like DNA-binding protein
MLATDFSPFRFLTCGLPERERLATWREEFGRMLLHVDIEPLALPFYVEAEPRALPGVRVIKSNSSAMHFQRTRALVSDADDSIGIIVSKDCTASQRGRAVTLNAGDSVAILSQEPADVTFAEGPRLTMFVARSALAERANNVDDLTFQLIPRGSEALRLLLRYLKLFETSPRLRDAVAGHVHDLMALALTQHAHLGESNLGAVATARLNEALDHIAAHFLDPALSLTKVAENMRISPRYVQRLLEMSGTSFTERVTELRLQRAYTLVTESRASKSRISDLALQAGFSDISHFNRLFRSRFGDTPRGVRAPKGSTHAGPIKDPDHQA